MSRLKSITFKVSNKQYEFIKDTAGAYGCNHSEVLRTFINLQQGLVFNIDKSAIHWWKMWYLMSACCDVILHEFKRFTKDKETILTLQALFNPIQDTFMHSLDHKDYPVLNEWDMKLYDIAGVLVEYMSALKLNDAALRVNKLRERLNVSILKED